jgi:rhodanese-related sulfurtransferase
MWPRRFPSRSVRESFSRIWRSSLVGEIREVEVNEITVSELLAKTVSNTGPQCVDVRSASEFASGHVPGAMNIPLEQIERRIDDLARNLPIVLICQSGARARMAAELLQACRKDLAVLAGGTSAWIKAGQPVVVTSITRWSLERQVRLAAGILVLVGAVLAATVDFRWLFLAGFVGLGLSFAGLTGLCPMAILLAKLPWNRESHCHIAQAKRV